MNPALSTSELTKKFGSFTAVNHINISIAPGQVCAFLGPNGAGKSTAIRMLCGILAPTSGSGQILGYDLIAEVDSIKPHLGYMSQKFSLYQDLTVLENLDFYAGIYMVAKRGRRSRMDEMVSLADLRGSENKLVANLSQGHKQRLALACAIIADPEVIFLDEPTSGVSPGARRTFFNIIQDLAAQGKTLIVSTHFMDEAERCSQIAFFNEGKILALSSPDDLKQTVIQGSLYQLEAEDPVSKLEKILRLDEVEDVSLHGRSLHVLLKTSDGIPLLQQVTGSVPELIEPNLEDVFLALSRQRGGTNQK